MSEHSPGPWRVMQNGEVVDANEKPIMYECGCGGGGRHEWEECAANAALIAAAPDLLQLAKEQTAWIHTLINGSSHIAITTPHVGHWGKAVDLLARCQGLLNRIEPE